MHSLHTMDLLLPLVIGIGLSMDCLAVAIAIGAAQPAHRKRNAAIIALSFGIFQAFMTLAGWGTGQWFVGWIISVAPLVAFFLLVAIGIKMILEGREEEIKDEQAVVMQITPIILLSLATSIDALAAGMSLALLDLPVAGPALVIGVVAFLFSFAGVLLGSRLHEVLGRRVEILGGLILIAIGIKIFIEQVI
jgi:putative Mn2+ efflux pump MntP